MQVQHLHLSRWAAGILFADAAHLRTQAFTGQGSGTYNCTLPAPAGGGIQPLRLQLHRFAGNWLKTDFELHIIQPACSTSRTCRCLYISAALQGVGQADGASVADAGGGGAAKHTWMSEKELADDPVANQV